MHLATYMRGCGNCNLCHDSRARYEADQAVAEVQGQEECVIYDRDGDRSILVKTTQGGLSWLVADTRETIIGNVAKLTYIAEIGALTCPQQTEQTSLTGSWSELTALLEEDVASSLLPQINTMVKGTAVTLAGFPCNCP